MPAGITYYVLASHKEVKACSHTNLRIGRGKKELIARIGRSQGIPIENVEMRGEASLPD
jgi:hypothetical protein